MTKETCNNIWGDLWGYVTVTNLKYIIESVEKNNTSNLFGSFSLKKIDKNSSPYFG